MNSQYFDRRPFLATTSALGAAALGPRAAFAHSASPAANSVGSALSPIRDRLRAVLDDPALTRNVAGAVVGVSIGGEEVVLAHGVANLNTGQPFTEDTGFLLGSVPTVLVKTVILRLLERGLVALDAPAQRYVRDFTLRDPAAASPITVRMLTHHTNGIDAHTRLP